MTQMKMLAVMMSAVLLSGCGGGSSSPEGSGGAGEPGTGGGTGPVAPVESLLLGAYPAEVEAGESGTTVIAIPFEHASGRVSFAADHSLPMTTSYESRDGAVMLTLTTDDISAVSERGVLSFVVSDAVGQVAGSIAVTIDNTSSVAVVNELGALDAALDGAVGFPQHVAIFEAFADLAKYSGSLIESDIETFRSQLNDTVADQADVYMAHSGNYLSGLIASFMAGEVTEYELEAAASQTLNNFSTMSGEVMRAVNPVIESTGRNAFPDSAYIFDEDYGLSPFIGNEQYGVVSQGNFTFSGEFGILNDILLTSENSCRAAEGENQ